MLGFLPVGELNAQAFPSRPVRIFVPNPPGGGADAITRLIADKLTHSLGQSVIVENRPGGSSIIATEALAKAAPDGHTLALVTDAHSINPLVFPKLPYDSVKDFAPVAQLIRGDLILVASLASGIRSIQDLAEKAKARPGQITYGSTGPGTVHHLNMELLVLQLGIRLNHVPYKGVSPAMADLIPGHVDLMLSGTAGGVLPNVAEGKLAGVAVTGSSRLEAVPNVPTTREAGLPNYQPVYWYGLFAPAGTPKDVVNRLNRQVIDVLHQHDVRVSLAQTGVVAAPALSPDEFRAFLAQDAEKYRDIIARSGARLQ
ncbi:MAG: tripartite tricarboxylate transporter substrate binding protein [Lautropia sp.]